MTNIMDNEHVRHLLDLLEARFVSESESDFEMLCDEIEAIL